MSLIDNYAKDGGRGRSEIHVVLSRILCGTNLFIWYDMNVKFTSYL